MIPKIKIIIKGVDDKNRKIKVITKDISEALDILMLLNGDICEEDLKP
jgi:hypothetical protein